MSAELKTKKPIVIFDTVISFFDRLLSIEGHVRTCSILIACFFILTACSTFQVFTPPPPPSAVTIAEDLHFNWPQPNSDLEMAIFISAGHYTRSTDDGKIVYYESENGLVSKARSGHPATKVKGGIAFLKTNGSYFIWEVAPSYIALRPLNGIDDETRDGPSVRIYLARVPEKIEHSLRRED